MLVNIFDDQTDLPLSHSVIRKIVKAVVSFEGQSCDEAAVHFVDKTVISELHNRYFGDPSPTDCISFPIDDINENGYRVLGDVFVCPEVAIEYAQKHHGNAYSEVMLYVIHGLLHLMGYDDINIGDRKKMRLAEKKHWAKLKELNLV